MLRQYRSPGLCFCWLVASWLVTACFLVGLGTFSQLSLHAQEDQAVDDSESKPGLLNEEYSADEIRQIQLAERFLGILKNNPRRGTALDRVYGHHIEFGTLDSFVDSLRAKTAESPDDGAQWMLLGLFESLRGKDSEAAEAFTRAEQLRPQDAMAAYYLAHSLLRVGKSSEGVQAMERAIACNPPRTDLLEIFQQLGRVHQRAQRTEEALAVWKRLEELFPSDSRVLEQIAITLAEEGEYEQALPRYAKLAESEQDDYRRTTYRVAAAELKIKSQKRSEGIADMEVILDELNPEGWLYRDVRRRIEDVFLRSGDQDNLVQYYESWIEKHPEDVEAMARLARFLSGSARMPEASEWMEKALKLAPTRSDLRRAFIDQLVEQQRFSEAAKQYQGLCDAEPNNIDYLRDWGKIVLRDRSLEMEQRQTEAARIWNLILVDRGDDPLVTAQVADLCRNAKLKDRAFELYKRAVELAPGEPQYREYLGEFYHIEKQPELALETWQQIAAPPYRNAENLARLAEVYNNFGYAAPALEAIVAAVELEPKEFSLLIRAAGYHGRAGKPDEALAYIDAAAAVASNDEQAGTVVEERVEILQASDRLEGAIEQLRSRIAATAEPTVEDWRLLARYLLASRNWSEASTAIATALELDPKSLPSLTTAANISEAAGDWGTAAGYHRRLADTDRRSRGDHLMNVARLEAQLGRVDESMQAANELILAAPGNTDNYEFFAQLCFRLGRRDEGLEALRKAVRINPNEPRLTMALGSALADDLQTREAIELYWRAFDKTTEVEDKTSLVVKLVPLYEQLNEFDQLIERLERDRREEEKRREMTVCIAQAYQTADDLGTARNELESLLSEDTRDTNLLQQLAKLCQASGDMESAISYQRQLAAIAPGHETEYPLALMLQQFGQADEAAELLVRITKREEDPIRLLRSIDSLLSRESYKAALEIIDSVGQSADDWELHYRSIVALAKADKVDEAKARCQRLLAIKASHDSYGRSAEDKFKQAQQKARTANLQGKSVQMPERTSPVVAASAAYQIRTATGLMLDESAYYSSSRQPTMWSPENFAQARMAAYGWLIALEKQSADDKQPTSDEQQSEVEDQAAAPEVAGEMALLKQLAEQARPDGAPVEAVYDYLYVASILNDGPARFEAAKQLARWGGKQEQMFFLSQLPLRRQTGNPDPYGYSDGEDAQPKLQPLSDEDLDFVVEVFQQVADGDEQNLGAGLGQIVYANNGQAYVLVGNQYVPLGSSGMYSQTVIDELRAAGRDAQAQALFDKSLTEAKSSQQLLGAMSAFLAKKELDRVDEFYAKWLAKVGEEIDAFQSQPNAKPQQVAAARGSAQQGLSVVCQWIGRLATDNSQTDKITAIADQYLDLAMKEQLAYRASRSAMRRPTTLRTSAARRGATSNIGFSVYYGDQQEYMQVTLMVSDDLVSPTSLNLLAQLKFINQRTDSTDYLLEQLQNRVQRASDETRTAEQALLATVLWWQGLQDDALDILTPMVLEGSDPALKVAHAELLLQQERFEETIAVIDAIPATDQGMLQQREVLALQVAERLGDIERAREAAERLFGLRLDTQTQLEILGPMQRLGFNDLAEAVMARAERSTGSQPAALAQLMEIYRAQGKSEEAKKLALSVLRRTNPAYSAGTGSVSIRNVQSRNSERSQALGILKAVGGLEDLIVQQEERLKNFPDVLRSYELLAEYYEADGQQQRAMELLEQALERSPNSDGLRMVLANYYQSSRKYAEACDIYLDMAKRQPDMFLNDYYQYYNVFRQAKRTKDLVELFASVDIRKMRQPYQIMNIASNLLNEDPDSELAISLIEQVSAAFPTMRQQMLRQLPRLQRGLDNERVFRLVLQSLVPSARERQASPWNGATGSYSNSADGSIQLNFYSIAQSLKGSEKLEQYRQTIQTGLDEQPEWLGGKLMVLAIDTLGESEKREAAKQQLVAMFSDDAVLKSAPYEVLWFTGGLLELLGTAEDDKQNVIKLYEQAIRMSRSTGNGMRFSPVSKLVALYKNKGQLEEAKQVLLNAMSTFNFDQYDQSYAAAMQAEQAVWCAEQLTDLGFIPSALQVYQQAMKDPQALARSASTRGRDSEHYLKELRAGFAAALKKVDHKNVDQVLEDLTTVSNDRKQGELFDIRLSFSQPTAGDAERIGCAMLELIDKLCGEEEAAAAVDKKLEELRLSSPDDLSLLILSAIVRLKVDVSNSEAPLEQLVQWLDRHPLEQEQADVRLASVLRQEAAKQLPLWLVARLTTDSQYWESHGKRLAERAVAAAEQQVDSQALTTLLLDWAQRATAAQHEDVRQRWSSLCDAATKRPAWQNRANTGTTKLRLPPLKQSQFDLALIVADNTAQLGFVEVSAKALREATMGGMPVPDQNTAVSNDPFGGGYVLVPTVSSSGVVRTLRTAAQGSGASQASVDVTKQVNELVERWKKAGFDDQLLWDTLRSIVLPDDKPNEIRMWADSSQLEKRRSSSLAATLVQAAESRGSLDELEAMVLARGDSPTARIPALVMRAMIAMERELIDEAKTLLGQLSDLANEKAASDDVYLAMHAALPAAEKAELKDAAMAILMEGVDRLRQPRSSDPFAVPLQFRRPANIVGSVTAGSASTGSASTGSLEEIINQHLIRKGNEEQLRRLYESRYARLHADLARYSGDTGLMRQWTELAKMSNEAAKLGASKLAFEFMGHTADMEVKDQFRPPLTESLIAAVSMTRKLEPEERYMTWANWTLHVTGRKGKTLRLVTSRLSEAEVPAPFAKIPAEQRTVFRGEILSNFAELVSAAAACGRLEDLHQRAKKGVDDKLFAAEHLLAFVLIEQAATSPQAKLVAEEFLDKLFHQDADEASSTYQKHLKAEAEFHLFAECLKRDLYFNQLDDRLAWFDFRLRSGPLYNYRGLFRDMVIRKFNERAGEPMAARQQPLKNWIASYPRSFDNSPNLATWIGDANSATLAAGGRTSLPLSELLTFAYPLTGQFEFSIDCYNGDWGECDAGYGGVVVHSQRYGSYFTVDAIGGHENLNFREALKTPQPSYGRYKIVSDGEKVTFFLNGYKSYEEPLAGTSPWIVLATEGGRTSRFMNPRISGSPVIPRQVALLAGDRMDGWNTTGLSQRQPTRRQAAAQARSGTLYPPRADGVSFDWETNDGELRGRKSDDRASDDQGWIFYHRPLLDRETFSYEFYYDPGASVAAAAPTLGRLALLLEEKAVQSHWISNDPAEVLLSGVATKNGQVEEACQRSNGALPLKQKDWNAVKLSIADGKLRLSLNDQEIFERSIDGIHDHRFGLFHSLRSSVRVRNASLSGNWPASLEDAVAEGWFQWQPNFTPRQIANIEATLPRDLDQPLLQSMVLQLREQPAEAAYQSLVEWVLPARPDGRIRMGYAFLPLEQQPELEPLDRLLSPAVELVRQAASLGRLPELQEKIGALQPTTAVDKRNQQALQILVMLKRDWVDITKMLGEFYLSTEPVAKTRSIMDRSAELLVAVEAGKDSRHWKAGLDIARRLQALERDSATASGQSSWEAAINAAIGAIDQRWAGYKPLESTQWASVPYTKPEWRANGESNSTFVLDRGALTHVPGRHWSQLFFQSPLQGEYEITARRSTHGYKEIAIATGMHTAEPRYDLSAVRVTTLMHNQTDEGNKLELPVWDQSADFRIAVDDKSVTTYVNGVNIHQHNNSRPRDPWLVLQADSAGNFATIRDLRITGNPTIPDEIDLIDIDGWWSWRFDMYGDWSVQQTGPVVPYNRIGNELVGNIRKDRTANNMESLMMYARPMLEDGEIEFETFYKPGETEVHPALGRTALMLDQPLVTLHRLTNAQWESPSVPVNDLAVDNLAVDNRSELAGAATPLKLKPDDWNQIRLSLKGDQLSLFVNGELVGELKVEEPREERFFGLFRYSDRTACRVRNLKYRGEWPKTLPPVEEQELAYPASGPYAMDASATNTQTIDLRQPLASHTSAGLSQLGADDELAAHAEGLQLKLVNGAAWERWPGVAMSKRIEGDAEIIVEYQDLQIMPAVEGWGSGLSLQVSLDDSEDSVVELSVMKSSAGTAQTRGAMHRKLADGSRAALDLETITGHNTSGRLRLVRQGGRIHCLIAGDQTDTFRLLHSLTIGQSPIRSVSVQAKSADPLGTVDVVIKSLTVKE